MNLVCTQCGTTSPPGNRFCGQCGSPLPPSPGNLPPSAHPMPASPPAAPSPESLTPCWQCGTGVDALRHPYCPTCGATLGLAPATAGAPGFSGVPTPVPTGPPAAPPPDLQGPPPAMPGGGMAFDTTAPFGAPSPAPADRPRREPLVSGPLLTVIVAIVIVLVLAVLGILAGQALGR